ncbi:YtfJ family protein [Chimaeribacter arupi]|uniref:YtfJ family protein n=2 Tax=Yersiniaceae TaxID=1903411 RepID=A0A2N5EQG4_9GAMM|nr:MULTISPECIES: YtfJ family protein [Yersiniaceae]MBS0968340.1 YtfJ family protein [Nissabacter archeti]MDV5139539.1 YtfJ family protein [Chimaeribacter arupi]PLR38134.1 YtfJ family protein [Chimaeribacter arupi]PLR46320.1 YtfJ family protein [Chimaeribacter arupi]PLR51840.1 YtfJ family protein [Chimaeribacter arupi]
MRVRSGIAGLVGLLLPLFAAGHDFVKGQRVPPVGIADRGEVIQQQDESRYQPWNSARLTGKVRVMLHIAGRLSAKDKNAALTEAISRAGLPPDRYQTTTIINTDDAITGSALFVRRSIEASKKAFPWSQFIIDSRGAAKRAWQLEDGGSAVVVLDPAGTVQFVRDGALTPAEVQQVMALLRHLLKTS